MAAPDIQDAPPGISVVVPVYACVGTLEELCARLKRTLDVFAGHYEIILVDDRSPDGAWAAITDIQTRYPEVKGIRLSRNFGQQIAISAGLAAARGDCAVVMDGDLQDPPEKIPKLYAKLQEGYDLVLARRSQRSHSLFRLLAAKTYFGLLSYMTEERIDGSYGSFSILSRKVIDSFLEFGERERHYLFILRWLGFKIGTIDYEHQERAVGRSSYSLKRLLRLAAEGVFFQATVLLRWIITAGLLFAVFGVMLAVYFVYGYFSHGSVEGWTSVAVLILICTGVLLTSMGVIGLYIGKIFDQAKERPLYVIDTVSESANPLVDLARPASAQFGRTRRTR
jgi:dolichol-phosphate mannosyltransferase